jgi:hypothetical protein
MTVRLWARLPPDSPNVLGNEKGKEKMSDDIDISDPQWRMAGKWDICLADLVPLPDEVSTFAISSRAFENRRTADVNTSV